MSNNTFGPGVYLIGDIKTFAMRDDLKDLGEGVHTLQDGAVVQLFRVPDHVDEVMFDQDNNGYSCESGYVGIIRADYLPHDAMVKHNERINSEDELALYSVESVHNEFSPSKIEDPLEEGEEVIVLGDFFLSHKESPDATDDRDYDRSYEDEYDPD